MTGLAVFFEGDHFKAGLRCLLKRAPDGTISTHHAFAAAGTLISVARHYVRLEEARLVQIEAVRRKIDPQKPRTMGRRNRDRLDQFDDERNVERLLNFPEAEATRALANRNPFRRAKGMERALAVSLLIVTALRIKNLRSIHLTRNIRRAGARVFVLFGRTESKNGIDIEIELPADTVKLLDRFIAEHRPHLPGHEGAYLFPGQDGGPKSDNAMREGINAALKRHAGLTVSPHLFRHIVAKIAIERDPSLYGAVSRHLGHKSIGTTLGSYLGTETKAASRRLNEIIAEAKASADAKGTDKRITRGRL
jgi:integrase